MGPLALYGVVVTYETLISPCFYRKCESLDLTCPHMFYCNCFGCRADGPAQRGGQSASKSRVLSRNVVVSGGFA